MSIEFEQLKRAHFMKITRLQKDHEDALSRAAAENARTLRIKSALDRAIVEYNSLEEAESEPK